MYNSIFPQAKIFEPFGLNTKDGNIFLSFGTSFQKSRIYYYDTFSPFDFDQVDYLEDLDMIILRSKNLGFSMRIYYVQYETITESFWNSLDNDIKLSSNSKICKSGKILGRLQPFTAYVEFYIDNTNSDLFYLITRDTQDFSSEFLQNYYIVNCLDKEDSSRSFFEIKEKESIKYMNSFSCLKYDSIEDKDLYFFSCSLLS